jgi:hypothetical protein
MRKLTFADFQQRYVIDEHGCWIWQGPEAGEYGAWGRHDYAHRASWRFYYGEIPDGLNVCHTCDVPKCVNPEHLFLGTQHDNLKDMYAKGRRVQKGVLKHRREGLAIFHTSVTRTKSGSS